MMKFYVLLEISSSGQLRKTSSRVLDLVLEQMDRLCADHTGTLVRRSRDLFFYHFSEEEDAAESLLEDLAVFFGFLREKREELQGFSLFADGIAAEDEEQAYERCRESLYRSGGDDSFTVGGGLKPAAGRTSLQVEEVRETVTVSPPAGSAPVSRPGLSVLLSRENLANRILELLVPDIEGEQEPRIVHLFGPNGSGKLYNLKKALERLSKDLTDIPWAVIPPAAAGDEPETPFLRGIRGDFLGEVPGYLSEAEKRVWDETFSTVSEMRGDRRNTEFILMYRLYLEAYGRYMEGLGLPAIFICESYESLPAGSVKLLLRFCIEFLGSPGAVPVIISERRNLDTGFRVIPRVKVKVSPMHRGELDRKLRRIGDAGTPVPGDFAEHYTGNARTFIMNLALRRFGGRPGWEESARTLLERMLPLLSVTARKILMLKITACTLYTADEKFLFQETGIPWAQAEKGLEECSDSGLVEEERFFHSEHGNVFEMLVESLKEKDRPFLEHLANGVADEIERDGRWADRQITGFICSYGNFFTAVHGATKSLEMLIERGDIIEAAAALDEYRGIIEKRVPPASRLLLDLTFAALRLRVGVLRDDDDCGPGLIEVDDIDELREKTAAAYYRLEYARYLYKMREFRKSLGASKRALFLLDGGEETVLSGLSNIEVGLSMMSMGKMGEGADYFTLASDLLRNRKRPAYEGRGLVLEATADFFIGSLDTSLHLLDDACSLFSAAGARRFELFSLFFRGRVLFRFGLYEDAAGCFERALAVIELYAIHEARKTVYAWLARCRTYLFRAEEAVKMLLRLEEDSETALFLAEAHSMDGNTEKGLEVLDRVAGTPGRPKEGLPAGEIVDWENGFSNLEDRVLGTPEGGGVLSHLLRGFRSYLLGRGGVRGDAYLELTQLTRTDKLGEYDPNNMLYYFFAADVLPTEEEDEEINRLTLLSKALKYLQGTASRISDPKLKQAYLWKNYWNAKLMAEGRNRKLL